MDMMRRKDRQQDSEFARKVLEAAEYGVLSMTDAQGNPYAIPISHALVGDRIYLHGATEGKKLRILEVNDRVCFTCVGRTNLLPSQFSTEYESVIVFGRATVVEDETERRAGLLALAGKYSPSFMPEANAYIDRSGKQTVVIRIMIEHMTAKAKLPKKP